MLLLAVALTLQLPAEHETFIARVERFSESPCERTADGLIDCWTGTVILFQDGGESVRAVISHIDIVGRCVSILDERGREFCFFPEGATFHVSNGEAAEVFGLHLANLPQEEEVAYVEETLE